MSKPARTRQHSLSFKVSGGEKQAFAQRCAAAGMTQSEMLEQLVLGRLPDEPPMIAAARLHVSLIHVLRANIAGGTPIDDALLDELLRSTRDLIASVRLNLER